MPLISHEITNRILWPESRKEEMEKAQKILDQAPQLDNQQLVEAWCIVGECHKFDMEPQFSEKAYLKALEVIQTLGNDTLLGEGYKALGDALYFCKQYADAATYYDRAAKVFRRLNETDQLVSILSQIAYCYEEMGQRDDERLYLNDAVLQPSIQSLVKATLMERIALSLGASGKYEEAVKIYEQALSTFESEGFKRNWQQRVQALAQLYSTLGNEEEAQRTRSRS